MQYRLKNYEQALQNFEEASRLDDENVEARKNTGFLLALLGRTHNAILVYREALALAPHDSALLRRLASLSFTVNDNDAGIAYARQAYDAMPSSGRPDFDAFIQSLQLQPPISRNKN